MTGGNAGIGLATTRGLVARGAAVVAASRRPLDAAAGVSAAHLRLDLADLRSVREAAAVLAEQHAPLDVAICNAGLWPRHHALSPQGHELAFATNVLGHFALLRELLRSGALARDARVVVVTGDIYILANDCTPDFTYAGARGGMQAYCRSKLGDIWIARELQRRHPDLHVVIAHPGVVATNLGGATPPFLERLRSAFMLSSERGAETSLYCATQPVAKAAYIHNTLGEMRFEESDPGGDDARAKQLWERCEALCGA